MASGLWEREQEELGHAAAAPLHASHRMVTFRRTMQDEENLKDVVMFANDLLQPGDQFRMGTLVPECKIGAGAVCPKSGRQRRMRRVHGTASAVGPQLHGEHGHTCM